MEHKFHVNYPVKEGDRPPELVVVIEGGVFVLEGFWRDKPIQGENDGTD